MSSLKWVSASYTRPKGMYHQIHDVDDTTLFIYFIIHVKICQHGPIVKVSNWICMLCRCFSWVIHKLIKDSKELLKLKIKDHIFWNNFVYWHQNGLVYRQYVNKSSLKDLKLCFNCNKFCMDCFSNVKEDFFESP